MPLGCVLQVELTCNVPCDELLEDRFIEYLGDKLAIITELPAERACYDPECALDKRPFM